MKYFLPIIFFICVFAIPGLSETKSPQFSWAIYWYLCGSDLETNGGCATNDLLEMMEASLPNDVVVIVQTGGAKKWQNNCVEADKAQRFLFHQGQFILIEDLKKSNMGDPETLQDFLEFCQKNYPAKRQMFLCWNHGAGSIGGVAFDEQYEGDSLTLSEMEQAFSSVYEKNANNPPFEVIGFDACLMATLDTARTFHGFSSILIASQDVEPGNGWSYTDWLTQLGKKTDIDGEKLGKIICDTYMKGCHEASTHQCATLSVIDINKSHILWKAMDLFGFEALVNTVDDKKFYTSFSRNVKKAENYGNNSSGYTNMVDLGQMIEKNAKLLPDSADMVTEILNEAVLYKVNGPYRKSSGISCFFPFDSKKENYEIMLSMSPSSILAFYGSQHGFIPSDTAKDLAISCAVPAYDFLNSLLKEGEEQKEMVRHVSNPSAIEGDITRSLSDISSLEDMPLTITEDGEAQLTLGADRVSLLDSVSFIIAIVDTEEQVIVLLGSDANITADWDSGIFKGHFSGKWPALNENPLYMEITEQEEKFYLYTSPILLNGVRYNLEVAYDFKDAAYKILGARKQDKKKKDKNLIHLKKGDKITPIMWAIALDSDEEDSELTEFQMDTFVLNEEPKIQDVDLGDGNFAFVFSMENTQNQSSLSEVIFFSSNGNSITIQKELEEETEK